ncbi:MAG TPA: pyridoxal phosphate-dependent aminotransferase, partial [Gemmatimonadaceae bacterium]|nr:pyridoxal phosphate-dependent aminotransferase [Gemmatimonadaceae bacterium]
MAKYLDSVPFSGIIRIRDMMYTVERPFRLDQGDVSFDAPDSVKQALRKGIDENRSHYVQTTGIPPLIKLLAEKMRQKNHIPIGDADEVMVTSGGIHGVYAACQAVLEPGDEVLMPDPEWPPAPGNVLAAHAVPVPYPLHESCGWRPDISEMRRLVTDKTRAIYVNSPNNPTGGVLTGADLEAIADIARERDLWVFSDEAYEDVLFDGHEHLSIASLPGMYERTIPLYTFSKTYAMTGLRLAYMAVRDAKMRDRVRKVLFYTVSNTSSLIQYGGVGALEGSQEIVGEYRQEIEARRKLFYDGIHEAAHGILSGAPPAGAFYAFLRVSPKWKS